MDLSRALGWLPPALYRTSPRAKPAALMAWHTPHYIAALGRAEATQAVSDDERTRHALGTTANPVFPEMYRRPATGVGGVMLAAELLRDGGAVHVPGGGTHHGMPDRANGFCYLNDPVFAILALRRWGCARVAYVDIDAHHPDGVEHAFARDEGVLMVSVHEENRWPRTGAMEDQGVGNVFNLPVPRGVHDDDMARVREALILPVVAAFRPDAIVLQAGADAIEEDPQSRMRLSNNAHAGVLAGLLPLAPRLMLLGGGGYNPWSVGRCWTRLWGILAAQEVPDRLPPEAEAVLRALNWDRRGQGRAIAPSEAWLTSLADPRRGGVATEGLRERLAHITGRLKA